MKWELSAMVMAATLIIVMGLQIESETGKRKATEKELSDTRQELKQTGDVLAEVRALRQDVNEVNARLKTLDQVRSETGEKRRENIKTELAGDKCAAVPVPDRVADSLYQRATEVSAGDYSGAFTGKPDSKN
ncbi:TPA: DUF2570 domain-containing protein [Citrobacter amalonaticus]